MEGNEALPDHLRCNRTDGKQWRCNRRVMNDKKLCEIHYLQGRHRQYKQKVPDSLKIERKNSKKLRSPAGGGGGGTELRRTEITTKKREKVKLTGGIVKRKRSAAEALDETLKQMKLKRGDLLLELIRVFLKRQVEKKKERELLRETEGQVIRELPNGVMAISPLPVRQELNNAGVFNVKLGLNLRSCSISRRSFRSKNIEPVPVGAMQGMPFTKNVVNLRKRKKKKCHWCGANTWRSLIKCSSCHKQFFCLDCIEKRDLNKEAVKLACPVCHGACRCTACSMARSDDVQYKDLSTNKMKVDKIQQLQYLIWVLLPLLERINWEQSIELEIEAKVKGRSNPENQIQQVELSCQKQHCCNYCRTSIVDIHRSCPKCSYNLCLSCCWEFCRGSLPGGGKAFKSKYSDRRKLFTPGDKRLLKMKQISTQAHCFRSTYRASPKLLPCMRACDSGSLFCPPKSFGGCSNNLLDLRCVFPFGWTNDLEVRAEEIVSSYVMPEFSDVSSCCSQSGGTDCKAGGIKLLQEVAKREDSTDNFIYCPTIETLNNENIEHFQKHWAKGHPVIVRNVLQSTSDISWDPLVMFCTYLEKSSARNNKEVVKSTNCLDWCEVEINNKQTFMGSLDGRTQATMCLEMVKLKAWLSSCLFREQFPAHYTEITRTLPLQEYTNPVSGLLNLAAKLPQELPNPDLGPSLHISYGGPEEFMQADSMRKLCYDSFDTVNILAHTTDVPITNEQLTKIKLLMRKYRGRDHRETACSNTDQKMEVEMNGKTSLRSEDTEESGLQDVAGDVFHLPNGIAKVSLHSDDSLNDHASTAKDKTVPLGNGNDSDASILCSGTFESSEGSGDWNFFQDDVESSSCSKERLLNNTCGAQWDVFRREDVPKLIDYLRKHSNEFIHVYCFPKHVVHPIFDQHFYLDAFHKMRLKEEFDIEPWTFQQHLGEAVIIPAGCPYQVKKFKSCVNVVLEFVSPENAIDCINVIDELRLLPVRHKAKRKVLEVKKMALYGISTAIEEIRSLTHMKDGY